MTPDLHSDVESTEEGGERDVNRAFPGRERDGKALCAGVTRAGKPCQGYALGQAYGEVSDLCAGHAGLGRGRKAVKADAPGSEGLGQAVGSAARGKQTPMDILRRKMEEDPETVADVAWKAMKEGRDIRALTAILDRTYGDETGHVPEPHTFDELAKLDRSQRRALLTQLEREGRGSPFRAPEH